MGDPTYSDRKVIRISLRGWSRVRCSTATALRPRSSEPFLAGDFFETWGGSTGLSVKRSRYIVDIPAALKIRIHEENLNFARRDTTVGGRRVMTWAARDLPKIHGEEFAADSNGVYMSVLVASPTTWTDIGKWYATNAKSRYTLTPAVESKLAGVLSGSKTFDDSLRAVHKWVAQDVRYVAISLGMGGYQPRAPNDVVTTGFGDCKDKATLFVAALNRMGITAFPVILNSSGGVKRDLPSIEQFDHAIAAYKRKGSSSYEYADLTADLTPLGELPFDEQGAFGLVVHPDGVTEEITLPRAPIAHNRRDTHIVGTIGADLMFDGVYEETATGALQGSLRGAFSNPIDSASRSKAATGDCRASGSKPPRATAWWDSRATGFVGGAVAPSSHSSWQGWFTRRQHGNSQEPVPSSMANMAIGAKQLDAEPSRRFPIDPTKIFGTSDAVVELRATLPEGWRAQLPPTVVATGPSGTYRAEYSASRPRALCYRAE